MASRPESMKVAMRYELLNATIAANGYSRVSLLMLSYQDTTNLLLNIARVTITTQVLNKPIYRARLADGNYLLIILIGLRLGSGSINIQTDSIKGIV